MAKKNEEATKYTLDSLKSECRVLFEISSATFEAVLSELEDKDKQYSVEEMAEIINEWQGRKVNK